MNWNSKISVIFIFSGVFVATSCKKEKFITDSSAKLDFSTQSILYDTVFTTVGSVTKTLIVYNRNSLPIKISSVRLARGTASNFRINVDGSKGVVFSDVEIAAKDSLFVFAEVTVDPNKGTNPLIISDSVIFETNGNLQDVDLVAYGQDAYFHTPNTIFNFHNLFSIKASVISGNVIWPTDKPHVVYGPLVVNAGGKLTMQPGTRVHMHPGSVLLVYEDGTLIINGNITLPVTIQGDRLEPEYSEEAGQWGYIWLSAKSKNNVIDWAIIKNGRVGILSDTVNTWTNPTLTISNTIIKNMSVAALWGQGTFIKGWNCVFANCGQYVAALTIGGMYNFYHCTFANYWSNGNRQFPVLLLNNYYEAANKSIITRDLDNANFYNCIVHGDLSSGEEIKLDSSLTTSFAYNFKFHYSLLRTSLDTSSSRYENIVVNKDPYFNDVDKNDYRIKNPLSSVIGKGDDSLIAPYPFDLSGRPRLPNPHVTIGAYEYNP